MFPLSVYQVSNPILIYRAILNDDDDMLGYTTEENTIVENKPSSSGVRSKYPFMF